LPRSGVPAGYEVARRCDFLLDVVIVRKIGIPGQEELAMGAIASGGAEVVNTEILEELGQETSSNETRTAITSHRAASNKG